MAQATLADTARVESGSRSYQDILTDQHARQIRVNYRVLEPAGNLVATLFLRRLREISPEIQPFLRGEEGSQRRQLLTAIALAVASLEQLEDIVPALRLLGSKYRAQGVTEMHYGAVGEALLWTLKQSLGKHWTNETADASTAL
jgi:hemoglobin-like flavoprotein